MQFWLVATLMVVATTGTLVVPLFWRPRPEAMPSRRRWFAFAFATAVTIPLIALGIYSWLGKPGLATAAPGASMNEDIATLHARSAMRGGGDGGDLNAAVEKLRARLATQPNDAPGWRLLAQSYQFQGRTAEAAEANKQAEAAERGVGVKPATTPVVSPEEAAAVVAAVTDDKSIRLAQQAEEHRRKREFPQAVSAFAALAKRGGMSADLWADYADALGGARGRLDADADACITAALRIDPDHPKALWLKASLQTQEQDFAAALTTWQHLARILPADSPD